MAVRDSPSVASTPNELLARKEISKEVVDREAENSPGELPDVGVAARRARSEPDTWMVLAPLAVRRKGTAQVGAVL